MLPKSTAPHASASFVAVAAMAGATPAVSSANDPEAQETFATLIRLRWNRRQAAKELGISYEALRWRIAKHGLSSP